MIRDSDHDSCWCQMGWFGLQKLLISWNFFTQNERWGWGTNPKALYAQVFLIKSTVSVHAVALQHPFYSEVLLTVHFQSSPIGRFSDALIVFSHSTLRSLCTASMLLAASITWKKKKAKRLFIPKVYEHYQHVLNFACRYMPRLNRHY